MKLDDEVIEELANCENGKVLGPRFKDVDILMVVSDLCRRVRYLEEKVEILSQRTRGMD